MEIPNAKVPAASVLVVDDNPLIINVLKGLLISSNYKVSVASNGREALKVLKENPVDLIICDVMMPKMDGYQLHTLVRRKTDLSHIPFLFLTALGQEEEICRGYSAGVDEYITKPFEPRELLAIVEGKLVRSRELKKATEKNAEMFRRKVIHTLSHELRTPLVAINTGTEMLLEEAENSNGSNEGDVNKSILEAIHRGGKRLQRMINDFIVLQQIEAGLAKQLHDAREQLCSVGSLLDELSETVRENLKDRDFSFEIQNDYPGIYVRVDRVQILHCLERLIDNGIKFSRPGDKVVIETEIGDGSVFIDVHDNGIGIDPAKIKEALSAFCQIDRDRLEQQGNGLGLAIADRFARMNGCELLFFRREGGGSTAALKLPISE